MGMEPVETAHPLEVALIAAVVFAVLILLSRLFRTVFRQARRRVGALCARANLPSDRDRGARCCSSC